MSETAGEKAVRLLIEGRLMILHVDRARRLVVAQCRGDSGQVYDLGHDHRNNEWRCNCQEMKGNCSHLIALKRVVVISSG